MKVYSATRKQPLSRGKIACVGSVVTVNMARGCAGECVFCYARCLRGGPRPHAMWVYNDLPNQLRRDLDNRARRGTLPGYVVFSTASDPFIGDPQLRETARACLEVLIKRDVGVTLSTRGEVPPEVIQLFAHRPERVKVNMPLASMSEDYTSTWEPGAASPERRLFSAQKLREVGVSVELRLEPVIPFVNDDNGTFAEVFSAIASTQQRRVMLRFLQLWPGVAEQLRREAPPGIVRLVLGCFPSQQQTGRAADYDHIVHRQAIATLRRAQRVAQDHGIALEACRCHNPGLPAGQCVVAPPQAE
ncbi:MAG: radical SAM protein, partial [Deltaproteobacteria bacterium]|nr:radical SAM protein [Deltaproteobacteria bacterium]